MDHAIAKLLKLLPFLKQIHLPLVSCNQNTPGELDNEGFAALAHSFAARFLTNEGRTEAERAATDWNAVILM